MIIKTVRVRNFRCIDDEILNCDELTALVGPNGSGKSTFLKALKKFYESSAIFAQEDFYNNDTSVPIRITLTFIGLSTSEKELFKTHMNGDELVVEKVVQFTTKFIQKYHGYSRLNPDFKTIRKFSTKEEKKAEYDRLKVNGYSDLPELRANTSSQKIEDAIKEWEINHPDRLTLQMDEGQFFGFKTVGEAHLEKFTRFLYIPSNLDASVESSDGKGTVIYELMNLIVRSKLAQNEDLNLFRKEVQTKYREILDPSNIPELRSLEGDLTKTIGSFAPGTQLKLNWSETQTINIPDPTAQIRIVKEGYETELERAGDGVKRAFILTTLQHLEAAKARTSQESENGSEHPNLILGIEEPELFQHPSRERHLARILLDLAKDGIGGVADRTQVIYTTHSPLLIDLTRFDQIRIIKRIPNGTKPKHSKICQSTMANVTRDMERVTSATAGSYSIETERGRLHTLMTPWTNEGFFANAVVLVEGEGDRAAIVGMSRVMNLDLDSLGISVIPCMGKRQVLKAAVIFRSFGLPVYAMWDCDEFKDRNPEDNHPLMRLHGLEIQDFCEMVGGDCACFRKNLDLKMAETIPDYNNMLQELREQHGIADNDTAKKSPVIIEAIIKKSADAGYECSWLKEIVTKIIVLPS